MPPLKADGGTPPRGHTQGVAGTNGSSSEDWDMLTDLLTPQKVSQQPEMSVAGSDTVAVSWCRKWWLH